MDIPTIVERLDRLRVQQQRIEQTGYPDHMQSSKAEVLTQLRHRIAVLEKTLNSDVPDHP